MGRLVEGRWTVDQASPPSGDGRFRRAESRFRNWITSDGAPGPGAEGGFEPEPDRYHLYVAWACPWAHRTLIFRKLKRLEDVIGISIADAETADDTGWTFRGSDGTIPDVVNGFERLWELYVAADPDYSGRVTVPALWDKKRRTIVSNESAEIIRMFNSAFNHLTGNTDDYYPEPLRSRIDEINARVYSDVNNGVYKAGFAATQAAYEEAVTDLFETLDWLEEILAHDRFLAGDAVTEADWRLLPTLARFDAVYFGHFKCSVRRIADYPNLSRLLEELFAWPGIAQTFDLEQTRRHYYWSHTSINPRRIVPLGPTPAFMRS